MKKIISFKLVLIVLMGKLIFCQNVFAANFTLQLGVYNNGNGADIYKTKLKENNVETFIVYYDKFYRVWYGIFVDEESAKQQANILKKQGYQIIIKPIPENVEVPKDYAANFVTQKQNLNNTENKNNLNETNLPEIENKTPLKNISESENKDNSLEILQQIKNDKDISYLKISVFSDEATALKLCQKLKNENFFAIVLVKTVQDKNYFVVSVPPQKGSSLYQTAQELQKKNYTLKGYFK